MLVVAEHESQLIPAAGPCSSGRARVVHLGVIFFLLFGAYLMLQAFAVTFYGESLASNTLVTLYAMFSVACLVAPAVTNTLGPRYTLGLGVLSYVPIPVASLLLVTYEHEWCRALVVLAGAISGVGGACMWYTIRDRTHKTGRWHWRCVILPTCESCARPPMAGRRRAD